MSRFGHDPEETNEMVTERCWQCHDEVLVDAYEPRADGPYVCDKCFRETMSRATRLPVAAAPARPAIYADLLECSERAVQDAMGDFKAALANAKSVSEALALHHRIQALYLGLSALSTLALEKADALCDVQRSA